MIRRLLAAIGVAVLAASAWLAIELYRPYRGYQRSVLLEIESGSRSLDMAQLLVSRGVLRYRLPFLVRYWLGRPRHRLKAGEYLFDRPLRPAEVYRRLIQGDIYLHPVVIPEGSDRFDMAQIFSERLGISPEQFLRVTEQSSLIHDLDPQAPSLEGYLFPDTYRFAKGVSAATVVLTMVARFRRVLASRIKTDPPMTPEQIHKVLTLASLVEKETPDPAERPVIAGVFVRRLAKGMPLQCDPTVVYAARINRRPLVSITAEDLNFDSPYNTYRHAGLPPGPIASPGEASIQAALHPAAGDSLYFVSNNHGGHIFSRTLAEHQRNVAGYRKERAALRSEVPEKEKQSHTLRRGDAPSAAAQTAKGGKHAEQEANHP
jgi:peptidoglycan lytic transglycosylase G